MQYYLNIYGFENLRCYSLSLLYSKINMFKKLVPIEPVSLIPSAEKELHSFANEVIMFDDVPASDDEIVARIGDADAVLLSYTSQINSSVIDKCPNIKYIGMCCSLFLPKVPM